jgi:S1-C subfamily serine protease
VLRFAKYLVFLVICTISTRGFAKPTTNSIQDITDETIALVDSDKDVFCSGVFVSDDTIITAYHCIEHNMKWLKYKQVKNDEVIKPLKPIGLRMTYAMHSELEDDKIVKVHYGIVIALDSSHDLALIRTKDAPQHKFAKISTHKQVGDVVQIVGHPSLSWTYVTGIISAIRTEDAGVKNNNIHGPFIQISGPIWHGDSGGGAFNSDGELIGIISFISGNVPNIGFAIASEAAEHLLARVKTL